MKAKDFLMIEQETIQVMAPFDIETVKNEFSKKAMEFEYSGVVVGDVKFTPDGITLVLQQGNVTSEVTMSYSDEVGPFAAVKPSSGESVNLDLTPMNPPVVDTTSIGKQIDVSNLSWLGKEAFEAIMAAAQIKEAPEEEVISGSPEQIGSDGSGASTPTSQQPQSPPVELDAKTVPAPRPQGQPSGDLPGESLETDESKKKEAKSKTADLPVPVQHQIEIAKKTLKMADPMTAVMGGMTKVEASEILKKYGLLKGENFNPKAFPGIQAEAMYRVTFKKDKDTETMDLEAASETDALTKAKSKLRTDQKILSVGKPMKKEESKGLTYFRFIVREGKRIKIPVGTNSSLIEAKKKKAKQINKVVSAKPFKPGQYWHSHKEALVKKAKEDADIKKDHLAKFGFTEVSTCNPVKKEGIYGYRVGNDDDGEMVNCPVCKGVTGKASPNCPRCKGKGYVTEQLHEQQVTKKFFITMANFLKNMPEQISKKELVDELIRIFQAENPRFDSGRFRLAAGA